MIIPRDSDFFNLSKGIAEKFLQSAIVVDDFADLGWDPQAMLGDRMAVMPRRRRQPPAGEADLDSSEQPDESTGPPGGEAMDHYLNAKKVIDGFAEKGIVCSVLRPEKEEMDRLAGQLSRHAGRADILVLDWQLCKDNGEWAMAVLCSILGQETGRDDGRLQLFAVYTGESTVQEIASKLKEKLERETDVRFEEDRELALKWPGGCIVVLAKPEAKLPEHYRRNVVPFEKLVERLIEEFTALTVGLVSNLVVESLAKVRKNTSRILRRFSNRLDAAYLSHRFMLPEPVDAETFLTRLIAEELMGILEEVKVGNAAGVKAIEAWLKATDFRELVIGQKTLLPDEVVSILGGSPYLDEDADGNSRVKNLKKAVEKDIHKRSVTQRFGGAGTARDIDEQFAHLTMMRAYYENTVPALTLGTIVKCSDHEFEYYVCVQPRCDSVRIEGSRSFPFLPLEKVAGDRHFDIVLLDDGDYVHLKCIRKPHKLVLFLFKPDADSHKVIRAHREGSSYYFDDNCESKKRYRWMGELRSEQALRLSDEFAAAFGRVGLDEFEWQRRWSGPRE